MYLQESITTKHSVRFIQTNFNAWIRHIHWVPNGQFLTYLTCYYLSLQDQSSITFCYSFSFLKMRSSFWNNLFRLNSPGEKWDTYQESPVKKGYLKKLVMSWGRVFHFIVFNICALCMFYNLCKIVLKRLLMKESQIGHENLLDLYH